MLGKERFVVDADGNRTAVLIEIDEYERLVAAIEELESVRVFDGVKGSGEETIPFSQAVAEIESSRVK